MNELPYRILMALSEQHSCGNTEPCRRCIKRMNLVVDVVNQALAEESEAGNTPWDQAVERFRQAGDRWMREP